MATKTSADLELRAPSSCLPADAVPPEHVEPWRQSSFDLHQGLEVTENHGDLEAVYVEWLESLNGRIPDPPAPGAVNGAGLWVRHFDGLAPEEAAQLAAMWWDQRRTLP
jgi:hypothetical protein